MPIGHRNPPAQIDPVTGRHLCCLCKQKPIMPAFEKKQPNSSWCSRCRNKKNQQNKLNRWNTGERHVCKNHPFSIVSKNGWIWGKRLCASCYRKRTVTVHEKCKRCQRTYSAKQKLNPQRQEYHRLYQANYRQRMKDSLGGIHF